METKIVFISCLKIFMKKLLGKNINHTNSNKKRGEKPDSLVTRSPHKVSTFVQQYGSDWCYSFCVHTEKENGKKIKYRPPHVACDGARRTPRSEIEHVQLESRV